MAQRYIPPSLRKKLDAINDENTVPTTDADGAAIEDLSRRKLSDLKFDDQPFTLHTIHEISHHYGTSMVSSTLHDTAEKPHQLSLILLFNNANPRWYPDRIIFAHTNIDILPGYDDFKQELARDGQELPAEVKASGAEVTEANARVKHAIVDQQTSTEQEKQPSVLPTDADTNLTSPIPIFKETFTKPKSPRRFIFHGYFRLSRVSFLKPRSPEVIRMLQQKWEPTNHNPNKPPPRTRERDTAAWQKSLDQDWAVLQLSRVSDDELERLQLHEPEIEVLPDEVQQEDSGRARRKDVTFTKRLEGQVGNEGGTDM